LESAGLLRVERLQGFERAWRVAGLGLGDRAGDLRTQGGEMAVDVAIQQGDAAPWRLSLPANTPREIVQRLNAEVVRAVASPEVREKLSALGYEPASLSVADFTALVASDFQRFGRLAREIGLRADQ
jgi:hypothetical protein